MLDDWMGDIEYHPHFLRQKKLQIERVALNKLLKW